MMAAAVRQSRSCGLDTFYWAHDTQLWDGTVPFDPLRRAVALGELRLEVGLRTQRDLAAGEQRVDLGAVAADQPLLHG